MSWEKYIHFGEKQEMFGLAYLAELIKKNDVLHFFPNFPEL